MSSAKQNESLLKQNLSTVLYPSGFFFGGEIASRPSADGAIGATRLPYPPTLNSSLISISSLKNPTDFVLRGIRSV